MHDAGISPPFCTNDEEAKVPYTNPRKAMILPFAGNKSRYAKALILLVRNICVIKLVTSV